MTRPGIEPRSPGLLSNTLTTRADVSATNSPMEDVRCDVRKDNTETKLVKRVSFQLTHK